MRIETISGLRGRLIEYWETGEGTGRAIVLRDDPPFPTRPYSVHTIYEDDRGALTAMNGVYDLTLYEARRAAAYRRCARLKPERGNQP